MLNVKNLIWGLAAAIIASSSAFADSHMNQYGFESKSTFPEGTGHESRSYGFVLPEGITVTYADEGVSYGPGDVVKVSGKNITVVDVDDEAQDTEKSELAREAFNNKVSVDDPTQVKGKGVVAVAISITTPGVVVTAADGRSATTGDTVVFRLLHDQVMHTPEQETPQEKMEMMRGFENK